MKEPGQRLSRKRLLLIVAFIDSCSCQIISTCYTYYTLLKMPDVNQILRVRGLELGVGRKNDNSDVANGVNYYGVASFLSWWKSVCN